MVTALLRLVGVIVQACRRSATLELLGFVLLLAAVAQLASGWWALLGAGVGLLLKSFELDVRDAGGDE